jgi:hypothetical protein
MVAKMNMMTDSVDFLFLSSYINTLLVTIKWGPCHRGVACPEIADGGEDPQIWRVIKVK